MHKFLSGQTLNRQQLKQQQHHQQKTSATSANSSASASASERASANSSSKHSSVPPKKVTSSPKKKNSNKEPTLQPSSSSENHLAKNLFSPLVSDIHISIHPPKIADSKRRRGHPSNVIGIHSGIQLPVIEWHREFRKGYSLLMWVCLHEDNTESTNTGAEMTDDENSSLAGSFMSTSSMDSDPQLLYRFATSASPMATGIQATLKKDSSYSSSSQEQDSNNANNVDDGNNANTKTKNIPIMIQVDTFKPQSQSKIDTLQSNNIPTSLTTKGVLIPNGQWTLICIQHSFPYLKRPTIAISLNGVEKIKSELAYPTLGGEAGEVMMDNYLLCNIPNTISKNMKSLSRMGIDASAVTASSTSFSSPESVLNISKVDFAGFGLFKESVPTLLQAILCEHGPCPSADGVIPAVPPVVQCKDGIVIHTGTTALNEGNHGLTHSSHTIKNSHNSGSGGGVAAGAASSVLRGASNVLSSPKRSSVVSNGPFSLSSHRTSNISEGRGIGIPLCTGVQLTEDVSHKGELFIQQLLSKLVLGVNASSAFTVGGRVGLNVNTGCNIGITSDVKIVGIVQPKSPTRKNGSSGSESGGNSRMFDDVNGNIARGIGNVTIYHATEEFLALEQKRLSVKNDSGKASSLPMYLLPSSPIPGMNAMPSFLSTYLSIDSVSYILQPFHLALPPPGHMHSLQKTFYHDSFDHLYDLVVYKDGALAASLIKLFVTNLYLGGRMREEIIHNGGIHALTTLLRRVLLRANRVGIMNCQGRDGRKRLWQVYAPNESVDDFIDDFNGLKDVAPSYIPSGITNACKWIITACSGPAVDTGLKWKRPSLSIHVRRTSDIALTSVFGMALDMDLWGGDTVAASEILAEVANLYCGDTFDLHVNPAEISEKYDSGYGRLLRGHVSIQYLLDMVRIRFGNETIIQRNGDDNFEVTEKATALKSVATSLSKIFYTLLKYSLFKQISHGEHDVSAIVAALSDCPLGSVVAHAVLTALRNILIFCEIFPNNFVGNSWSKNEGKESDDAIKALLEGTNLNENPSLNLQQSAKLKRIKSEIAGHLARNLLMGQFHDVIAPMLLSRTVFDGRRNIENSNDEGKDPTVGEVSKEGSRRNDPDKTIFASCEWQNHWIITLQTFVVRFYNCRFD